MSPDAAKAISALAAAIEAFSAVSPGTSARLTEELRAYLAGEKPSIAATTPSVSASPDAAEIERLRDELKRTKEALRGRGRRAAAKVAAAARAPTVDPRQVAMFVPSADVQVDVQVDARTPSLSTTGSDHTNQIQRSESPVRERPPDIEPVLHDPDSPPQDFIALAESVRADLPEAIIRFSWKSFASRNRSHECVPAALSHWENWIRGEDRAKAEKRMYTAYRPPAAPSREPDFESPPEEPPPAPPSTVQRVRAKFGLLAPEPTFATPMDALEALMRLDRDPPEPRAMSA